MSKNRIQLFWYDRQIDRDFTGIMYENGVFRYLVDLLERYGEPYGVVCYSSNVLEIWNDAYSYWAYVICEC